MVILKVYKNDKKIKLLEELIFYEEERPDGLLDFCKRIIVSGHYWEIDFFQETEKQYKAFGQLKVYLKIFQAIFQGKEVKIPWLKESIKLSAEGNLDQRIAKTEEKIKIVIAILKKQKHYLYDHLDMAEGNKRLVITLFGERH